ncbi:hypothetical protein ACT7C9_21025 [Bacillus cereus]
MNLKDTKAMNYLEFIGYVAKTNLKYLEKRNKRRRIYENHWQVSRTDESEFEKINTN